MTQARVEAVGGPLTAPSHKSAPPCVLVVFGATGDLTRRKLLPAVARLVARGFIGDRFALVGVARRDMNAGTFASEATAALEGAADGDAEAAQKFASRLDYVCGEFADPGTYERLRETLEIGRASCRERV